MIQGGPGAYESTTTVADAAGWLAAAGSLVVTTHQKPDGDAVGASLALARALLARSPGVRVELWYSGPLPDFLAEVAGDTPVRHIDTSPPGEGDSPDAVVVVDTGAWSQVEALRPFLEGRADRTLIVDHHLSGSPELAERRIVDPRAAAAAQIVAGLCAELLGAPASRLPVGVAEPLYLGLATDTGWFRFSNVSPATMRLAADLIEAGVDHTALYRIVELRDRPGRLRLFGRAAQALELFDGGRVALMTLSKRDFAEAGAAPGDTGGFADRALAIETVMVAAVLTEAEDRAGRPVTKVSMRSKDGPGAIDVNRVAGTLGGGGHARAAGARVEGPLERGRASVLAALGVAPGG